MYSVYGTFEQALDVAKHSLGSRVVYFDGQWWAVKAPDMPKDDCDTACYKACLAEPEATAASIAEQWGLQNLQLG